MPLSGQLPRGIIHNDANDYNVLVGDPAPAGRPVAGLLDFGDMVETWTVCELAVAIAYAIFGKEDPLAAACHLAAGYDRMRPLTEPELEALWSFTAIRLCTSVCLSAHRRTAEPDNLYLMVSEAPAWEALERMRAVHPRLAHYRLRAACGRTPVSADARDRGVAARAPRRDRAGRPGDRSTGPSSSTSRSAARSSRRPPRPPTPRRMTAKLFGAMRARGAAIGIGRYDEARLLYMSDAFAGSGGEHPERRTVHIAIDIFMEPGSPVLAPLPGRVHSVRDNAARLDYGPTVILEHAPADAPRLLHALRAPDARLRRAPEPRETAVERGQRIATIGPAPENGDWPPHVHFQVIADMLDMRGRLSRRRDGERAGGVALALPGPQPRPRRTGAVSRRAATRASASRPSGGGASGPRSRSPTARRSRSCAARAPTSTTRPGGRTSTWSTTSRTSATATPASCAPARGRWRS